MHAAGGRRVVRGRGPMPRRGGLDAAAVIVAGLTVGMAAASADTVGSDLEVGDGPLVPPTGNSGPPVGPDPPARRAPPVVPTPGFRPTWDLDDTYTWLGPVGAASRVDGAWDSTFGGQLAVVRVREREMLAAIGGAIGGSAWTERGGGRVWLDALAATRIGNRMIGITGGPILELAELAHPRLGASVGVWTFVGIAPFVRVGAVSELGMFAELGIHVALPVLRH